jgi:polyferredoxin
MSKIGPGLIIVGMLLFALFFLALITNMALIHMGVINFPMSPVVPALMLGAVWCGALGLFATWAHHYATEGHK